MEAVRGVVEVPVAERLVVFIAALGGCALLYAGILGASWTHDDPIIVRHVVTYSPGQFLFDPSVWREYNWRGFFPSQLVSYWLDRLAFGVEPLGYRVHQLTALAVLTALFYLAVRRFASRTLAGVAAAAVLVGPVMAEMAQQLMTRHYVEGAIAALLAWLAVDRRQRGDGAWWSLLSAALFLIAVLAKEVYAPLPLLLLFVYRRRLRAVADALVLMTGALGVAVIYRGFMIEGLVRSYRPDVLEPKTLAAAGGQLATGATRVLTGGIPWWGLLGLGGIVLLSCLVALSDRHAAAVLLGGLACAVAPTLLVAEYLEPRHGFHVWLLAVAGAAWSMARVPQRWGGWRTKAVLVSLAVVVGAGLLVGNRVRWSAALDEARLYTNLWDFVVSEGNGGDSLLAPPFARPQYFVGAYWLRGRFGDGRKGPTVVGDRVAWCVLPPSADARLFEVADGSVVPVPGGTAATLEWCRTVVRDAVLTVDLNFSDGRLGWRLGPYDEGRYDAMLLQVEPDTDLLASTFPVPREGSAWMAPGADTVRLVVVYYSPEGWIALTPALDLDLEEGLHTCWPPSGERDVEPGARSPA